MEDFQDAQRSKLGGGALPLESLCAVVNNNVRCYEESLEFADYLDGALDDAYKGKLLTRLLRPAPPDGCSRWRQDQQGGARFNRHGRDSWLLSSGHNASQLAGGNNVRCGAPAQGGWTWSMRAAVSWSSPRLVSPRAWPPRLETLG
jgi:hypothetical protein